MYGKSAIITGNCEVENSTEIKSPIYEIKMSKWDESHNHEKVSCVKIN